MKEKIIYWTCIVAAILIAAWLIRTQTNWLDKWPKSIEIEEESNVISDAIRHE